MSEKVEHFTSRWGLVLATLGMAVGTGNIWRFPRVAASNGGGSFLVAWLVFLLLWSVPLIILEFSVGKHTRQGVVKSFGRLAGDKFRWMGGWVALCATAIMFYYSVVAGWCLRYLGASLTGELQRRGSEDLWNGFAASPGALGTHALAMTLAASVVWFGVRGIEKVAKVLIPTLLVLVVILAIRAVTLPGAEAGLEFLFKPDWSALTEPRIWLEALTQNAWDTGAGWGLVLTYAIYMRSREDVGLNGFLIGFGNNSVSLLAGIMVLCTVFALNPAASSEIVGAGNEGLTFIWMPQLFASMPGGSVFMVIFFLALSFAALTSQISLLELATRIGIDFGLTRKTSLLTAAGCGLLFGSLSALYMPVFRNQDWVWGVGLMVSGLFFAIAAARYGLDKLRREVVNAPGNDLRIGRWWTVALGVLVPLQAVALLLWWLWPRGDWDAAVVFDPLLPESTGTVLAQWALALVILVLLNALWLRARRRKNAQGEA